MASTRRKMRPVTGWLLAGLLLAFCSKVRGAEAGENRIDLYDSNRVLELRLTMAPGDWERLCEQERNPVTGLGPERLVKEAPSPFTWFEADVSVDGKEFKRVGVRKRGFFGSADTERPALNVDLNRFVKGQKINGRTELKLHNNKQDPSNLRQALAYRVFSLAGVPSPQCTFAHVKVNGKDMGIYSNIEPIDDAFLKAHFDSKRGNLYEASLSDFHPRWVDTFVKKNNQRSGKSDIFAVTQALDRDDEGLLGELERRLDVDAFITFWAVESLINHWDGFAGDQNNCYIYNDPSTGKLRFIPWGTDATFGLHHMFPPFEMPASVMAVSYLPRRLYNHPGAREQYRQRMRELLKTVWDEKKLLAEIDRMDALLTGKPRGPLLQVAMELGKLKRFVVHRRAAIETELEQESKGWSFPKRTQAYTERVGRVKGKFVGSWSQSLLLPSRTDVKGSAQIELEYYGQVFKCEFKEVKAAPDPFGSKRIAIALSGSVDEVKVPLHVFLSVKPRLFSQRETVQIDGVEAMVGLVAGVWETDTFRFLGSAGSGTVRFEKSGTGVGDALLGEFETDIHSLAWEDFDLKKLPGVGGQ